MAVRSTLPRAFLVVAITCFVIAPPVHAQDAVVTVIGVDGDLPEDERARLGAELLAAVHAHPGLTADDYTNVTLIDTVQLIGCGDVTDECLVTLGDTLETSAILYTSVAEDAEETWLELSYFDALAARIDWQATTPIDGGSAGLGTAVAAFLEGHVVLEIDAGAPGIVSIDGEERGRAPLVLEDLEPGSYTVTVGFDDGRETVVAVTYEHLGVYALEIEPVGRRPRGGGARAARPPSDGPQVTDSIDGGGAQPLRIAGWSSLGVGVAALGAGAVFGSQLKSTQDDFDATPYQRYAYQLAEQGNDEARRANAMFAVGGTLVATGVVLVLIDSLGGDNEPEASGPRVRWSASAGPGRVDATVRLDL